MILIFPEFNTENLTAVLDHTLTKDYFMTGGLTIQGILYY